MYKSFFVLMLIACSCCIANAESSLTPEQQLRLQVFGGDSIRSNPSSLSEKEQSSIDRQSKYAYREKGMILSPYIAGEKGGAVSEEDALAQAEEEKLYKYFSTAINMHDNGKIDEAIEILKYIMEKRPDDKYVKNFLDRFTSERISESRKWKMTTKNDARILKSKEIDNLVKDGIDYYKQNRFDLALLKFSDVLAIDPGNAQAKSYLDKLKEYYLKEVRVERLIEKYEEGLFRANSDKKILAEEYLNNQDVQGVKGKAEKFLDEKEYNAKEASRQLLDREDKGASLVAVRILESKEAEAEKTAERMMDDEEMEKIANEKRVDKALDDVELGLTIDEIIAKKKAGDSQKHLYTLGAGDVIQISVRDHPELSGKVTLGAGGETVLPLVNDIVALRGLTIIKAADEIKKALVRYVHEPYVTISIEEYKSKLFYVLDETGSTPYPITRTNLTLRDALFVADWGPNRALGRVIVMKPHRLHPMVKKIDAYNIIFRGNLADNILIEDGDVIYVPLTASAKFSKIIVDTLRPFAAVRQVRDEWLNQKADIKTYKELPRIRERMQPDMQTLWTGTGVGEAFPGTTLVTSGQQQ